MCDIAYIWNLKNDTYELVIQSRDRPADIEDKFIVTVRERGIN